MSIFCSLNKICMSGPSFSVWPRGGRATFVFLQSHSPTLPEALKGLTIQASTHRRQWLSQAGLGFVLALLHEGKPWCSWATFSITLCSPFFLSLFHRLLNRRHTDSINRTPGQVTPFCSLLTRLLPALPLRLGPHGGGGALRYQTNTHY